MMPMGWADKLYWRPVGLRLEMKRRGRCCFKRARGERTWTSLCGRYELPVSGGQAIQRPPLHDRCVQCNELEMKRRGWDNPGLVRLPPP